MRAAHRYLLFQIPGLILFALVAVAAYRTFDLPAWSVAAAFGLWIAKEIALYPLLIRSFARRDRASVDRLIGTTARVTSALDPEGWVRAGGELWRARSSSGSTIAVGSEVEILAIDQMTLIVDVSARPPA